MSGGKEEEVDVVDKVKQYLMESDEMERDFYGWCRDHCDGIEVEAEEYKLQYTELHKDFLAFFETKLESLIADVGSSPEEFYKRLKEADRVDPTGEDATFTQLMLAAVEFEPFMQIMKETAAEAAADVAKK